MIANWFKEQRLAWIGEILPIYGFINRNHIERKFRVSTPQASMDLRDYMKAYPKNIQYDATKKQYMWTGKS